MYKNGVSRLVYNNPDLIPALLKKKYNDAHKREECSLSLLKLMSVRDKCNIRFFKYIRATSTTNMNTNQPTDEFDVEVLAEKIWRINVRVFRKLTSPVRVLLANKKRFVIFTAIALVAAVIGRFTIPATYKSSFVIKSSNPTDIFYLGMLSDLNLMIKDDNVSEVARLLKLDEASAEKIKKIEPIVVFKNEFRKDTITGVDVHVYLSDPHLIGKVQEAIVINYLDSSEYYQKIEETHREELFALEQQIKNSIRENDSLKKVVIASAQPRGGNGFVYGQPIDPSKVYETGIELNKRLISLKSAEKYLEVFTIAKPGIVRLKPWFPRLIILLPICLLLSWGVCIYLNIKKH